MKKTSVITAVAAGVLVLGLIIGSVGFVLGGKNGFYFDLSGIHSYNDLDRQKDTRSLASFDSVELGFGAGDVTLVESDHFGVEYDISSRYTIDQLEVKDGTLYISVGYKSQFFILNFDINWPSDYIKIFYPAGTKFKDFDLAVTSGSVTGNQLEVESLNARVSSGGISLENLTSSSVTLIQTSGDSQLSGVKADSVRIEGSSGQISVNGIDVAGQLYLKATSGDIKVKGAKADEMEMRLSSGTLSVEGAETSAFTGWITSGSFTGVGLETGGLDFQSSSGNVKLDGTLRGVNRIHVTSGTVRVTTALSESGYSYKAYATSGDIRVDGREFKGEIERDTENSFDISASSGDITLNFGS